MLKKIILSLAVMGSFSVHPVTIIGIAGGTASGKTTLAKKLQQKFVSDVRLISEDDYYFDMSHLPLEEIQTMDFAHPDTVNFSLLKEHLIALKNGTSIFGRMYDFATTKNVQGEKIEPAEVIIVEGFLLFTVPEIRDLLDVKIFVEAGDDIRLLRRIQRDQAQLSRSLQDILTLWHQSIKPMHDAFVQPNKQYADLIVESSKGTDVAAEILSAFIESRLHHCH